MDKNSALSFLIESCFGEVDDRVRHDMEKITHFHARKKREFLFHEGEEGKFGYFLASGSIKLFRANVEGKEVAIKFVRPGEFFGWLVLLMEGRYPVSAICLEHVETLAVDINGVCGMLRDRPDFTIRMFQYIARRQKVYLNSIKDLAICCPRERLLNYLNYLAEQEHSRSFKFPVPKGEIALLLGITPETFSRMLRKLVDENIITIKGKEIHLLRQWDNFRDSGKIINNCGFGLDTGIHRFGVSVNG